MRRKPILISLLLLASVPSHSQVLARPGWAGSGVAPESWWRRAVFYRLDPARFQDSDGDGQGDLHGVVERLDYLQSLGVDALVLDGAADPDSLNDLDDLIREASTHHLRILLTISPASQQGPRDALLATVHSWLGAGAAGVLLPKAGETPEANNSYATLSVALGTMLHGFPGERVLLTDPAPGIPAPRPAHPGRRTDPGAGTTARGGQLVTAAAFPVDSGGVTALRSTLSSAASQGLIPEANPLLRFANDPAAASPNAATAGALLLASKGAAVFEFGDEIGLDLYPVLPRSETAADAGLPVMQWTPSNHTPAASPEAKSQAPGSDTVYGAYHPYQPMIRGLAGPLPSPARVTSDPGIAPAPPAPDTLPGFTAGAPPAPSPAAAQRNVVTEDRDPRSLLNFYRALIGLHHDNATLRNGNQYVLNHDAEGALVWLRRAPENTRTVANVLVAANLTDKPVTLALDTEIEGLGMRAGALRSLASFSPQPITGATTGHLLLPPHAVFLGEIYHAGSEPVPHERRHSGHRVRR